MWFCSLSVWRQVRAWVHSSACATTAGDNLRVWSHPSTAGDNHRLQGHLPTAGDNLRVWGHASTAQDNHRPWSHPLIPGPWLEPGLLHGCFSGSLVLKSEYFAAVKWWGQGRQMKGSGPLPPLMDSSIKQGTKRDWIYIYSIVKQKQRSAL